MTRQFEQYSAYTPMPTTTTVEMVTDNRTTELRELLDEFASAYDFIGGEDEEHQKYLNLVAEYAERIEQAIAATLGSGTCELKLEPNSDRLWWCSRCHSYHEHLSNYPWEHCPRCGAKAVSA